METKNTTASIRTLNGSPTLFIHNKPVYPAVYRSISPTIDGYENSAVAKIFAEAGIHLISIDVGTHATLPEWRMAAEPAGGQFDFSAVKKRFGYILDADPEAKLLLRINLDMPSWWQEQYPEECEILSNGEKGCQSFASKIWQAQSQAFLRAYVTFLQENGLGDRVFAYQPGGGNTTEWVKPFAMKDHCGDYSSPMVTHFCDWLYRQYRGDRAALRDAWRDAWVCFETASIPSREEQMGSRTEIFRNPEYHQNVIDYYNCWNDLVANLAIESCKTIKDASQNTALAGVFFGKLFELAWNSAFFGDGVMSETSAFQRSGHLYLNRVLESPYVDFITSSYMYSFRGSGGAGAPMLPTESLHLHGKLHLYDDDSRTHLSVHAGKDYGRAKDLNESTAILQRNFAEALTRNLAITWLSGSDAYPHFHPQKEPAFQDLLKKMYRVGNFSLHLDRTPSAEIAVIIDAESFFYGTMRNDLDLPAIVQQRLWGLPRLGAPFDIYLLDDFIEGKIPNYKLYIFLNAFAVNPSRRKKMKQELVRAGATALWIYAPGYIQTTAGLENMTDLTGFRFGKGDHAWGPFIHLVNFEHPITRDISPELIWGTNQRLKPVFYLEDDSAQILGQAVLSQGRCVPGFGVKTLPGWTSIYSAAPNLPAPLLRGIARFAGVHIYSDMGDVLSASRNLLSLHTVAGGKRDIVLRSGVELIYDLFENTVIAENTNQFMVDLQPGSTRLFYTGPTSLIEDYWKTGD